MMDTILKILDNDIILQGVALIVAAGWMWLRKQAINKANVNEAKRTKYDLALDCIAAGVEETWETYVRGIKAGAEDGKLTTEERAEARSHALQAAVAYARAAGLDLLEALGSDAAVRNAVKDAVLEGKSNVKT